MRALLIGLLLCGCGTGDPTITIPDNGVAADMTQVEDADLAMAPDLAWTDLAGGVDIAEAPQDFAQAAADMACAAVPSCGPPLAQAGCCNGALHCINGYCQNTTGEPCNTNPANGVVVTCYMGKACNGNGVCN